MAGRTGASARSRPNGAPHGSVWPGGRIVTDQIVSLVVLRDAKSNLYALPRAALARCQALEADKAVLEEAVAALQRDTAGATEEPFVVLRDRAGNFYALTTAALERCRVPETEKAWVAALLPDLVPPDE